MSSHSLIFIILNFKSFREFMVRFSFKILYTIIINNNDNNINILRYNFMKRRNDLIF